MPRSSGGAAETGKLADSAVEDAHKASTAPGTSAAKDVTCTSTEPGATAPAEAYAAAVPAQKPEETVADANKRVYFAVAVTYLAALSFGFSVGYPSPALPDLRKCKAFSESDSGWFASLVPLGAIFGGLMGGRELSLIGRRGTLILASTWFLSGWFLIVLGTPKAVLFVGRALTGIGSGMVALACSVFISEISPPKLRGLLNTGANLVLCTGILVVFILGKFLSFWLLAAVCLMPAAIMVVAFYWCPESPRWLLKSGHRERAAAALRFYVGPGAEAELVTLERAAAPGTDAAAEGVFSARDLALPYIYRPILCVTLVMTMQQMSAVSAIISYAHDIFEEAGTSMSADNAAVTVAAIQVVMVGVATVLSDRLGRKPLFLFSTLLSSVCLALLGVFFHLKATASATTVKSMGWLPLASLWIFFVGYSVGLGPLPWTVLGEMIPLKAKGFATGACTATLFAESFVVVKTYNEIRAVIGTAVTYWMFSATLVIGFILILMYVPETKGRDLEEIERLFGKPTSSPRESLVKVDGMRGQ
ncbi:solute carrier family 2, facilitated glucose transporter member 8-like [Haemaphysalis longicornis]